jgi:hypothetical protein
VAQVDERWFVRQVRRVMDRDQSRTDLRIEWAVLVLGLAGVVAIWRPFAGVSPIDAWRLMSSQAAYAFTSRELGPISAMFMAVILSFFLAPLVSLAQLSRCLGRPCSIWERRIHTVAALIAIAGCLALLVVCVKEGVIERGPYFMGSPVAVFVALGIVAGVLVLWRRVSKRHTEHSAECLLIGAYIGGVATSAAIATYYLGPTEAVAGFTCVVYAVSLWRRVWA